MFTQLKVELHDMGNLLTRLRHYCIRGPADKAVLTMDMTVECFRRIRNEVYYNTEVVFAPINMGNRFKELKRMLHDFEEAYGILISIDRSKCRDEDAVLVPVNVPNTVLSNAIQNASKAGATKFKITYVTKQKYVEITYSDNGKGMTAEELENMGFSIGGGKGTRLIRDAVGTSGGVCFWRSFPGVGTDLVIRLPRFHPTQAQEAQVFS